MYICKGAGTSVQSRPLSRSTSQISPPAPEVSTGWSSWLVVGATFYEKAQLYTHIPISTMFTSQEAPVWTTCSGSRAEPCPGLPDRAVEGTNCALPRFLSSLEPPSTVLLNHTSKVHTTRPHRWRPPPRTPAQDVVARITHLRECSVAPSPIVSKPRFPRYRVLISVFPRAPVGCGRICRPSRKMSQLQISALRSLEPTSVSLPRHRLSAGPCPSPGPFHRSSPGLSGLAPPLNGPLAKPLTVITSPPLADPSQSDLCSSSSLISTAFAFEAGYEPCEDLTVRTEVESAGLGCAENVTVYPGPFSPCPVSTRPHHACTHLLLCFL